MCVCVIRLHITPVYIPQITTKSLTHQQGVYFQCGDIHTNTNLTT